MSDTAWAVGTHYPISKHGGEADNQIQHQLNAKSLGHLCKYMQVGMQNRI